jgi:Transcription termination and cleavage factor C-terminal
VCSSLHNAGCSCCCVLASGRWVRQRNDRMLLYCGQPSGSHHNSVHCAAALLAQVMNLTPEQIELLPEQQKAQVIALQAQMVRVGATMSCLAAKQVGAFHHAWRHTDGGEVIFCRGCKVAGFDRGVSENKGCCCSNEQPESSFAFRNCSSRPAQHWVCDKERVPGPCSVQKRVVHSLGLVIQQGSAFKANLHSHHTSCSYHVVYLSRSHTRRYS